MKTMLCYSGGKDSTAVLIELIKRGQTPDKIVFADTLLELPEMYAFLDLVEKKLGITIIKTKPNKNFFEWAFGDITRGKREGQVRGMPLRLFPCWYQREAKVIPLTKLQKDIDVVYIGYAKGEEKRIMKDKKFKYPLIEWGISEFQAKEICRQAGLLNPLYDKFDRLGCFLCPKQPQKSKDSLKKYYPTLYNIYMLLEERLKKLKEVDGK